MNLYELNQAGYAALPNMNNEQIKSAVDTLIQFLTTFDSDFYMLVSNEVHYYTLFTYKSHRHDYTKMAREIISVAKSLGKLKAIERNGNMVEFWIKDDDGCRIYPLFDYERGVVQV